MRLFRRKILRISAYVFGSLAAVLIGFHFWFINHAEQLLEDLVESQSKGKIRLRVQKFRFNWFRSDMQLRNAVFYSTDTVSASNSYRFNVERIHLQVKEIFPFIFKKQMVFDSLYLVNPDVQVTRFRSRVIDTTKEKNFSLTQEMGKVYNSIQDALEVLKVKKFRIDNGRFTLTNRTRPDELPVTITHIDFRLENLRIDSSQGSGRQKIFFSDNVALQTHNQDIFFPDGRHRLSFAAFRINLAKKMVEFDSCTVAASKGDSARNAFRIFFDKLRLTNIDFDTLYQKEVIQADSVYCINPQFRLDVELEKRQGKRKPPPRLNELIQQLTGDLKLAFVVVNNASFDINTVREGRPSSFTSDHNNFEMQGLSIKQNSNPPVTVRNFVMAIRNYENFLRDSTYAIQFDSILLDNNGINLSNFSFRQMQNDKVVNNFMMPRFLLRGLSWDDLVFERKLTAERATLYHPVINYSVVDNPAQTNKRQNIFQALAGIGNVLQLTNLDIADGQVNVYFKGGSRLQLENANLSLLSRDLFEANRISNLQSAIRQVQFKTGTLKIGDIIATLENADFAGSSGTLIADRAHVINEGRTVIADAMEIEIDSLQVDDPHHSTAVAGIRWKKGSVQFTIDPVQKNINRSLLMKDIQGNNTDLTITRGSQKLSTYFENLSAGQLILGSHQKPVISRLSAGGRNFSLSDSGLRLNAAQFRVLDHQGAELKDILFAANNPSVSISVAIPSLEFLPDVNEIIQGSIKTEKLNIVQPVINLELAETEKQSSGQKKPINIDVGELSIRQPEILFSHPGNTGLTNITWLGKGKANNLLQAYNLKVNSSSGFSADRLQFMMNSFSVVVNARRFEGGKGEMNALIDKFSLEQPQAGKWQWEGKIRDLAAKDFVIDSLSRNPGRLEIRSARLNDLSIGSAFLGDLPKLVRMNQDFRLKEITGIYENTIHHFEWSNGSYDRGTKAFLLDSFAFFPLISRDSFFATRKFQSDYMKVKTGSVKAGPFDIDTYLRDTVANIGTVYVNDGSLSSFRDKRLPFKSGVVKRLPAAWLRKFPLRMSVDSVFFKNGHVEYTELNDKTGKAGTVIVSRMDASLFPVRNYGQQKADSLQIQATGYLMDSVLTRLCVKQSMTDTSGGLLLTGQISPADARLLNPVLIPLASVKLESGFLDTMTMTVTATESVATGEMKMFYHDLKIKFLNNQNEKKKTTYKGFASFLANTFVVKNNNRSRTGTVYFERIRERSPFHYLVKITISGVSSTVGIKNNKRLLREYKKALAKRNLASINHD